MPSEGVYLQYEEALKAKLRILQWRSPDLDPKVIADPRYRALLSGSNVRADLLETFKHAILKELPEKPPETVEEEEPPFVFVNPSTPGNPIVHGLLANNPGRIKTPTLKGNCETIRCSFENNLIQCHGLILLYGPSDGQFVNLELKQCLKLQRKRKRPLDGLAVYDGPPKLDPGVRVSVPGIRAVRAHLPELSSFVDNATRRS